MKIKYNKRFSKQLKKSSYSIQKAFKNRLRIFVKNPYNPILDNHKLKHEWHGHRSIDITGDWRVIYYESGDLIIFRAIGTHSKLYK